MIDSFLDCHDPRQFLLTSHFIGGFALLFFILVSSAWQKRQMWIGKIGLIFSLILVSAYFLFLSPPGVKIYSKAISWLNRQAVIKTLPPLPANELRLITSPFDTVPEVLFVYFGYTFCPDVCPTTLSHLQDYYRLSGGNEKPPVLFVTLDAERDTPEKLEQYLKFFVKDPHFLRLQDAELGPLAKAFSIRYQRNKPSSNHEGATAYTVDHSAVLFLLSSQGKILKLFPHDIAASDLRSSLESLVPQLDAIEKTLDLKSDPDREVSEPATVDRTLDSKIEIQSPWVRAIPGRLSTGAFFRIVNHGTHEISLKRASSPLVQIAELHTHDSSDGVMKMKKVDQILIPANGGIADLEPGSFHVMLIDLKTDLNVGDLVPLDLEFSNGEIQKLKIPVRKRPPN